MNRQEPAELAVLCLVRRGNQILLQNRVKPDWKGYALPGGHVEPGESFVDAVIREMQEETGLTVTPKLCGLKQFPCDGARYIVFLFTADEFTGTLTSSSEGEMVWVDRDRVCNYETVPDFEALLDVMTREDLTEFTYLDDWTVVLH